MVNKKGQEMSVTTLILIIIGIVLLVVLILGFTMGWQNLWNKINILGGTSNIETVIQACNLAATSDSTYSYCSEFKQIKVSGKTEYLNCEDSRVTGLTKTLTCSSDVAPKFCEGLTLKAGDIVKVNGKTCALSTSEQKNVLSSAA